MIKNYYPTCYLAPVAKKVDLSTVSTKVALTALLVSPWLTLHGTESGAEMKEAKGKEVELTTGQKISISENTTITLNFLQVDPANYTALRLLHKTKCAVLFYEADSGFVAQGVDVFPKIYKTGKDGELLRIKIDVTKESGSASIQTKTLT
jgi:hypothetical protein